MICRDAEFSRMLYLELLSLHRTVRTFDTLPDRLAELLLQSGTVIADCDTLLPDEVARLLPQERKYRVVLFGYERESSLYASSEDVFFFERPFPMRDFLNVLRDTEDDDASPLPDAAFLQRSASEDLYPDEKHGVFYFRDQPLSLTKREYEILLLLFSKKGTTVSREEIREKVFGKEGSSSNIVDVYIRYLRQKIDEKYGVKLICSVRGCGYTIHNG